MKVSLHYLQNWQNYMYADFSHGNLTVEMLSKIVSTIQTPRRRKCGHFFSRD